MRLVGNRLTVMPLNPAIELALPLIKKYEGCRLEAYLCPANVWTIGYGSTWFNKSRVKKGDTLPSEQAAEKLLIDQLGLSFLPNLIRIPFWSEMSPNQQAALISFAWNMGANFYGASGFNTITQRLATKDWERVPEALALYVKAGGKALWGLIKRRKEEGELWSKDLNAPAKEVEVIHYFLEFSMSLDGDSTLEGGRLVLRSITESGGREHVVWIATSSVANKQKPEDFHQRGGPIPPAYRLNIKLPAPSWTVETTPLYLPAVKGVEGNFYKITPFAVKTDKGGDRSDLGIHRDANVPGSAGCIVMSGERFKSFELEMKRLRELGYMKLPLFVTYPTD